MPRRKPNIVHPPAEPKPVSLLEAVKVARVFCVPVSFVTGEDMYNNWKRRCARLRRARIGASAQRQAAINSALKRLSTGSMQ